jgi:hypothetical protein
VYSETIHADVGYCLAEDAAGFAFQPPHTVMSSRSKPLGQRAVQNCPAVNGLERQLVVLPSPIGLRLVLEADAEGPSLAVIPQGTFVEAERLAEILSLEPPARWRDPRRPVVTLRLPFFFVTDEPCWMSLLPPFLEPQMRRWPGTMVGGRFPLTVWPQDLAWSLEWDAPGSELVLRQGEPLAYALFEFDDPAKRPRLFEAAPTRDLTEFRAGMRDIHHLTPAIEEIWAGAAERRPARLAVPLDA